VEKDHAILIRRSRLTETSLIIHWCAPGLGLVKTVAKGARNPKNKFHGNLDLFYEAEIEIVRSRSSNLHILKDLSVTNPRFGIRKTYPRTLAAAYFITLLETVCERDTPIDELFHLLKRALDYLDKDNPDWKAILHFEKELTRILGLPAGPLSPIQALGDLYHRVPSQRGELQSLLQNPTSRSPFPGGTA
jgi:DNA repair protein RecO (recombination protein O)